MAEVCTLDWHVAPLRADRFLDLWEPAAAKMPAYGAKSWSLIRAIDDPLAFQQSSVWEQRSDFERQRHLWGERESVRGEISDLMGQTA